MRPALSVDLSPLALIASNLRSTSKKPVCPITHPLIHRLPRVIESDSWGLGERNFSRCPRVKFAEFLRPNSRPYTLAADQDADLVGMRWYGYGPFHREHKPALRITKKTHFQIRAGDIIYNKLFAWRGSFGIVESALAHKRDRQRRGASNLDRCVQVRIGLMNGVITAAYPHGRR
jgi:hypothetical protein